MCFQPLQNKQSHLHVFVKRSFTKQADANTISRGKKKGSISLINRNLKFIKDFPDNLTKRVNDHHLIIGIPIQLCELFHVQENVLGRAPNQLLSMGSLGWHSTPLASAK
jgi:hypothetical protein